LPAFDEGAEPAPASIEDVTPIDLPSEAPLEEPEGPDIFGVTSPFDPDAEGDQRPAPELMTPTEAPRRWPDLVEDYALDRPFTSSPLRHSTLRIRPQVEGDSIALEVEFANEHYHDLFLADADNRKSLRGFLATRFASETAFALMFATAGARDESDSNGTEPSTNGPKAIHPAASTEAVIQSDPVIQAVIKLFEGRVLN
jgi:hypothetical protein